MALTRGSRNMLGQDWAAGLGLFSGLAALPLRTSVAGG